MISFMTVIAVMPMKLMEFIDLARIIPNGNKGAPCLAREVSMVKELTDHQRVCVCFWPPVTDGVL